MRSPWKQIPLAARIFAIVDVWDALTSDRPYRKAWPEERVIEHIQEFFLLRSWVPYESLRYGRRRRALLLLDLLRMNKSCAFFPQIKRNTDFLISVDHSFTL